MEVNVNETEDGGATITLSDLTDHESGLFLREGIRAFIDESEYAGKVMAVNPDVIRNDDIETVKMHRVELSDEDTCVFMAKGVEKVLTEALEDDRFGEIIEDRDLGTGDSGRSDSGGVEV